jgi:hypothetical protein
MAYFRASGWAGAGRATGIFGLVGFVSVVVLAGCKASDPPAPVRIKDASAAQMPPEGCMKLASEAAYADGHSCLCAADCETGNCQDGKCCSGAACAPKRPDGATCKVAGDCLSGFCVDGVCCNTACNGPCVVCNLPIALGECNDSEEGKPDPHKMCAKDPVETCGLSGLCDGNGKCAQYQDDTICRTERCETPTSYGPPALCNGMGKCIVEMPESCDPARCEANRCVITCTSDAQCAPGKACVNGACGDFPDGRPCTKPEDCLSGFCADGVCCNTECDEPCFTCAASNKRGVCSPASAGTTDPMCEAEASTSCGTSGRCDGNGQCGNFDNNTICEGASCDEASNTATGSVKCSNGACPENPASHSCSPYQGCNGANCRTSCSGDDQCVSGYSCSGGRCVQGGGGGTRDR